MHILCTRAPAPLIRTRTRIVAAWVAACALDCCRASTYGRRGGLPVRPERLHPRRGGAHAGGGLAMGRRVILLLSRRRLNMTEDVAHGYVRSPRPTPSWTGTRARAPATGRCLQDAATCATCWASRARTARPSCACWRARATRASLSFRPRSSLYFLYGETRIKYSNIMRSPI